MDAISERLVDNYMRNAADMAYTKAIQEWEAKLEMEEGRNAQNLKNPQFAASLGLPAELPDYTIQILKRTMAMDKIGPDKPEVDKFYRRYGFV